MIPATSTALLWLVIVYALLAALLLVLCLATRWHWAVKLGGVLLVSAFYAVAHTTLMGVSGWPSDAPLPEKFVLLSAVFDEPSPARGHAGAIYIWVNPMKDNAPLEMPRVHRVPYEKDLHRLLGDGLRKAREGNTQMGSTEPRRGPGGFSWLRPPGSDPLQIKLSDLPRAQLPEK
ncbi:hypothetical protein [Hydrogenophaga crocea]|uniref:Uncharacterized protein n=1 Tax=Hydrogenophaga crocea TaxID=2716225 RepID=A0A6G8IDT7_9BURK|nr:hypothetical protein [Hydrogenophaga crocea]QIM51279.1 hypothetical protein G9Q37_03580 [Hydrogenophaga crocea]